MAGDRVTQASPCPQKADDLLRTWKEGTESASYYQRKGKQSGDWTSSRSRDSRIVRPPLETAQGRIALTLTCLETK